MTDTKDVTKYNMLFTLEVAFQLTDEISGTKFKDSVHTRTMNTLVQSDTDVVNITTIGRAQQAVQRQMFSEVGPKNIKIHDVVTLNIIHLGWMTDKELQPTPPEPEKGGSLKTVK